MPAYRWLAGALREEILGGRLQPGARLPATRDLASQHGLARGTIVAAFEQLRGEGYLVGAVGSGTYVNRILPDQLLEVSRRPAPPPTRPAVRRHLSAYGRRVRLFAGLEVRPTRAFRTNQPALDQFPTTLWAQIAARRWRRATTQQLVGCGPLGLPALRQAVADYLTTSRGVACTVDRVVIVSGVQEAIDLVARLTVGPGDRVCLENPGYPGAARVFEALGARIVAIAVDGEGLRVPGPSASGARLGYLTPAHQFPIGIEMSLPRRLAILAWARRTGALIFEDDYDSEYRYAGRPIPALQGLDRHGVVVFAGTFSKVLFPSLRLGYLVVPPDLVDRIAAAKSVTSRHPPLLDQAILTDFIVDGHFGRHIRRMRQLYAERREVLLHCARERLAGLVDIVGVEAGLQTAGWLAPGIDAEAATRAAATLDVEVTPLTPYYRGRPSRQGLQLGFAAVDPPEIRRGVNDLATALERLDRGR
jgi:GntR family transcriptional regulator/MocR family aminotransferase